MKFKINTKLIIFVSSLVTTGLVVFISINANRHLVQMSQNNTELYSAFRISELMKSFRSNIIIMENKQKGYLASGDARFFEDHKQKESETKTYLKSMEKYFSGKPEEELFYLLKDLTYKKLTEAKDLGKGNLEGFRPKIEKNEDAGMQTIDELHNVIDQINSSLNNSTKILIDNSVEYVKVSRIWGFMEVAITIIASLVASLILFRDVNLRTKLESELRVAKKQAEDNANTKEQFMANVSHEIRTPMNAILGFSTLLNKTRLDKDQNYYLNAIRTSSSNLLNIINDILDFSKIEAGKLHIEKIPFNLVSLLDSLRIMFAQKAEEKEIGFEILIADKIPQQIFGDPTRLTQILVNLVSNAIKFTDKGSVKLSCELKSIEHDIVQLVFRVKDTGIGIPADKLNHVFERFDQGNKETTRKYGGTGLGLSIVKSLLEIQNGDIQVKSKEGKGSEFIVTISYPVAYEDASALADPNTELTKLSDFDLKVLLAEDNLLNQKLASAYLGNFGLSVEVAENGRVAIEKLKSGNFDLVLMDIQMPVLDGYNTAIQIRNELHLNIPIIAMTAHVMVGEKEKCISFGMNDYISKPFKEAELYNVIKQNLALHDGQRQKHEMSLNNSYSDPDSIVNLSDLLELSRGNNSFVREMIDIFVEQNPLDLKQLEDAGAIAKYNTIRAVAHRMKTSIGFMGIKNLLPTLTQIETMAENRKDIDEINRLLAEVRNNCTKAIEEFKHISTTLN